MEHKPLRWAVAGSGVISSRFAKALAQVPGHVPHTLVSRDPERAGPFARRHGFEQVRKLDGSSFSSPDFDVIYIGTPTHTHRDLCLQAIRAGKPFLCEKPMTASLTEFLDVLEAWRAHPVYAMEAMWLKFNPLMREVARHMAPGPDASSLGQPLGARMQIGYADHAADEEVPRAADAISVFGCYGIALSLSLFGEPVRVFGHGLASPGSQGLLQATMLLDYGTFHASIDCSVISELSNALQVQGTRANVSIPVSVLDPYRMEIQHPATRSALARIRTRLAPMGRAIIDLAASRHPLRGSGFRGEVDSSGQHIRRGESENPDHPLRATESAHRVMEAARLSVASGQWVDLQSVRRSR